MSGQGAQLWGGRFAGASDPRFTAFNASLSVDRRLAHEDVRGSMAWARALARAGVLAPAELERVLAGLAQIEREITADPAALARSDAEDVHAFVESRLRELAGDLAKKLHTGRSRNDQVATDLKLWCKSALDGLEQRVVVLQRALVEIAERHAGDPMPGYTHLQRAQAITIGHHALAYVEMLERDRTRFADARARLDVSPLGSGALAGTAYAIDRAALAQDLGFAAATRNSLDAVSDRDHACEMAFACSLVLAHLSRFAEDWIFFATQESRFLELSDAVASGSSLMPQKKNPDSLELLRGKSARVFGRLVGLLTLLKGLPLAYDKDLQEDKEALFDAVDTTSQALEIAEVVVRNARFDVARCRAESAKGYVDATDLADLLVARGVPFRTAHEEVGAAVRAAIELGVELGDLPDARRHELVPALRDLSRDALKQALSVDACLARRDVLGGTAPVQVRKQAGQWKERLERWNSRS